MFNNNKIVSKFIIIKNKEGISNKYLIILFLYSNKKVYESKIINNKILLWNFIIVKNRIIKINE